MAMAVLMAIIPLLLPKYATNPNYLSKRIQRSFQKEQLKIETLLAQETNLETFENNGIGVFVYHNDSLQYWNTNEVSPRLLRRKVILGTDTICNLLNGDYYIKSFKKADEQWFVFKQVNSTYKLENEYFENKFRLCKLPAETKVKFNQDGIFELSTNQGKMVGKFSIVKTKPTNRQKDYFFIGAGVLFIIGIVLLVKTRHSNEDKKSHFRVEYTIFAILILAIIATYAYNKWCQAKENKQMAALAEKLMDKHDVRFERSFAGFSELVKTDTDLHDMIYSESNVLADVILGYCKELLFDETMAKYNVSLTLCKGNEEISIQPEGYIMGCEDYFEDLLANNKNEQVEECLYFMDYNTLDPSYLGIIELQSNDTSKYKTLYFEFYKPVAPEGFGFPQLLQEKNNQNGNDYSVANYKNDLLVYKYGKYIYPNYYKNIKTKEGDYSIDNNYKHYTLRNANGNVLIISTPRKGWSEITAPFAVFFLGMLIPMLLIYWLCKPKEKRSWKDRTLRQKMQTVVFSTLAIALITVVPVSLIYMRSLYNKKTLETHYETTRTVATELSNNEKKALSENTSRDEWTEILQHYANTFFIDLNLYAKDGHLTATTRQEVYELNLQGPLMNPEAYKHIHGNEEIYYTHEELLGKGSYESAYIPLTDANGVTLAYLNTPYFSSVTDLQKEIRNFVLTYINIILVLLGIALIFVLSITRRLTEPLTLIQNKLGDIKIDQKNEPIEWKGNDEIGALVKQYNQLIVQLEESTAELKRNTTEKAWRGVARQVAHEIKNSLTPMRLSVQMLQRNVENGNATPEQIKRTSNTLIEQIDALSDIAASFSRYAKLPENHPQPLDLAELLQNLVNLYDNQENIQFQLEYDPQADHTYEGDKTNLNSAIGNIIKNATQAIGSKPEGLVLVSLKVTETHFIISVKDNGKGIKEEDKERIFLPNFTTKSGGSGVGLSLAYNIVLSVGGTITFESEEGRGAEFVVSLPKVNESQPQQHS